MKKNQIQELNLYNDPISYDQIHTQGVGKEFKFYKNIAEKVGNVALEIACGTGRLTIPLAKAGVNILGIDISDEMLSEAKRKAAKENVSINWIQADCSNFSLIERFPFIFIPCNSFQHLYDVDTVKAFLGCVKDHLKPDGLFVLDVFKPDLKILSRNSSEKYHVMKYKIANDEEISLDETNYYNPVTQVNNIKWFHTNSENKIISTHELTMRQFFPEELKFLLRTNGFRIVESYGSWDLEPISDENFKQILVCKAV